MAGSVTPHDKFEAGIYFEKEELESIPFHNSMTSVYIRTTDIWVNWPSIWNKMIIPGIITITVELISPVAMSEGLRFAIRKVMSCRSGRITKLLW